MGIVKKNKIIFYSKQTLDNKNKNKIFKLIKNYKKEKANGYHLSIDNFKEKMKKNRKSKMKEHIDNYWKVNKNFVTNLIENRNKINYKQKLMNKIYFSPFIDLTENSKNINNSVNFNNSLSIKLPSSSKNIKPKYIFLNKNIIYQQRNRNKQNSLLMKIQNDSDFMKNKNYSCVFPKENKIFEKFRTKKNLNKKQFKIKFRNKTNNNNFNNNKHHPMRIMETYSYTNYKFF